MASVNLSLTPWQQEVFSDPRLPDTDDDGLADVDEVAYGTDPIDSLSPMKDNVLFVQGTARPEWAWAATDLRWLAVFSMRSALRCRVSTRPGSRKRPCSSSISAR